ncbi:MAG: thiamine ABC transporter substrate-binding protein [Acidimicrobiales bacterium]
MTRPIRLLTSLTCIALFTVSCGDDARSSDSGGDQSVTITLVTHDSFAVQDALLDEFTERTRITVEVVTAGDTGQMISQSILSAGDPLGDVMFGVDNTFLQRALDAGLFIPYEAEALADVADEFVIDDQHRVTPIDFGDVCVNYWTDALPGPVPTSLADLIDPVNAGQLVVQSPESSSPGLAFLLATIAGTDDWEQFWTDLRANGVRVTPDWESAYYGEFTSGGGDRSMVVSYASSPPVEMMFAAEPIDEPPTGVLLDSCYRQIEFAGVLAGTPHPEAAGQVIEFLLSEEFQNGIPESMFVFPVSDRAELPETWAAHAQVAENPLMLDPAEVEANRDEWIDRWVEIVLG